MDKIKHTPGPWQFYADLPSTDPNWHIVTNASRMRVLANIHIEPGNETDLANARVITAAPDMAEILEIIAADADAGTIMLTSGVRLAIDAALIKAGRKKAPEPVRHFRACGEGL
ncbi:hypothetical protein [Burkholderia cenocepacia]|uniref:hypothetical protein n=1 Tax=Burkholderia cenocepacia TaxID=95486 RepID=UPI002ABE7131|nr:hypothetical protein [Burkholderia cenocepacia]